MRWYINDTSLQGQFKDIPHFLAILDELLKCRNSFEALRNGMYLTRSIADQSVTPGHTLRQILQSTDRTELRRAILLWLDRRGPFVEDDRQFELDDYFECEGIDVTDAGLGEATRRIKAKIPAMAFSFAGSTPEFGVPALIVSHGLQEDILGTYVVENVWELEDLAKSATHMRPLPSSWMELIVSAREQFPRLVIPDTVYTASELAKEPFELPLAYRTLALLKCLDDYMRGRTSDGVEGVESRAIIETFFTGDRALFSGESASNQNTFRARMTFPDPLNSNNTIFAHWHGKISHRFFRLHFEWPVPPDETRLKVLYLGPKITKK